MKASFSRVSPRRAFILLGTGAVAGLAIAGYSLFTAKGTAINFVPAEDVALVNQQPILVADFEAQLQTSFGVSAAEASDAQKAKVLHDMIREEVYVQRSLDLGMPESDPDSRNALVASVEQQAVAEVTTDSPAEAELKDFYNAHQGRYVSEGFMTVRDLTAPSSEAAAQAAAALRGGAKPEDVIAKFGLRDSKKISGEDFYFAARIHLGDRLFTVARKLRGGEISQPIALPDGIHILAMAQNTPSVPLSFAQARERVVTDFKNDAEATLQANEEKFLTSKADIQIAAPYRKYRP